MDHLHPISDRNLERFRSAKIGNPRLTFDRWVDQIFELAAGRESIGDQAEPRQSRRGRPTGASGRGVTGATLAPHIVRYLLSCPKQTADSGDVVRRIEKVVAPKLTDQDRELTAARVPRWQHAIYSQVAYMRSRGIIEKPTAANPSAWRLTDAAGKWLERSSSK